MTIAPIATGIIKAYHAHIYYDTQTRPRAATLRSWVEERCPLQTGVQLGRWHDAPVGPHPQAMYQILFPATVFPTLVPFLMLNRLGLTVLVHPETGRPRDDHLLNAFWMGAVLVLNADILPEVSAAD